MYIVKQLKQEFVQKSSKKISHPKTRLERAVTGTGRSTTPILTSKSAFNVHFRICTGSQLSFHAREYLNI